MKFSTLFTIMRALNDEHLKFNGSFMPMTHAELMNVVGLDNIDNLGISVNYLIENGFITNLMPSDKSPERFHITRSGSVSLSRFMKRNEYVQYVEDSKFCAEEMKSADTFYGTSQAHRNEVVQLALNYEVLCESYFDDRFQIGKKTSDAMQIFTGIVKKPESENITLTSYQRMELFWDCLRIFVENPFNELEDNIQLGLISMHNLSKYNSTTVPLN